MASAIADLRGAWAALDEADAARVRELYDAPEVPAVKDKAAPKKEIIAVDTQYTKGRQG